MPFWLIGGDFIFGVKSPLTNLLLLRDRDGAAHAVHLWFLQLLVPIA